MIIDVNKQLKVELEKIIKISYSLSCNIKSNQKIKYTVVADECCLERFKLFDYEDLKSIGIQSLHILTSSYNKIDESCGFILFFLAPIADNIRLVNAFLETIENKIRLKLDCHIIFTCCYLPKTLTDCVDIFEKKVNKVYYHQILLSLYNYDSDVILLNNNYYYQTNMIDHLTDTEEMISHFLNKFDIKNNAITAVGKNSVSVSGGLIKSLIKDSVNSDTDNICSTILVDRDCDLLSLMRFQTSSGGLVNEVFGCPQSKEIKINVVSEVNAKEDVITINKFSHIYKSIQYMDMTQAGKEIKRKITEIRETIESINGRIKTNLTTLTDDDKKFIKNLCNSKNECKNLITLLTEIIERQCNDNYILKVEIEELITNGTQFNSGIINKIISLAMSGDLISAIRYLILYGQQNGGFSNDDCIKLVDNDIKLQFTEWPNILRYLKQQGIIKKADIKTYVFNWISNTIVKKNYKYLFANIVKASTTNEIINIVQQIGSIVHSMITMDSNEVSIKQNIILIIMDGITIDEIKEIRLMAEKYNKKVTIITNNITTATCYINKIRMTVVNS